MVAQERINVWETVGRKNIAVSQISFQSISNKISKKHIFLLKIGDTSFKYTFWMRQNINIIWYKHKLWNAKSLNIVYDGIEIKQHAKVKYLGCILDKSPSG